MSEPKKKSYRQTLNLPKTSFAMRARLVEREPQMRKEWARKNIYKRILEARKDAPVFTLHDGPPYPNGDIHMGHVINKVLKDFVVKYKTMAGYKAPYIPGWDCHGLPIESKVVSELGEKIRQMSKPEIRKRCKKYADKYVKIQSRQFQELGIFGEFDNPYLTVKPEYETGILEVFARMVEKGLVFKQLKPIHWCAECETALAEAELDYQDITSPSIFVNFPATEESINELVRLGLLDRQQADEARVCFMIWTTTPWTLAANLAVAVHPYLDYAALAYEQNGSKYISILVTERIEAAVQAAGLEEGKYQISRKTVRGSELEALRYKHPFVEQNPTDKDAYKIITAQYVTTEDGTGLVHIAPGHGTQDYLSGKENELEIYSPVNARGNYDETVPAWLRGKSVFEVDELVNSNLMDNGWLFSQEKLVHSYPHCWRSKGPVIFRATEQWFISVDKGLPGFDKSLRELALQQVGRVTWIPPWGQKRMEAMLQTRPDWCISRQRSWGLPIPAFVNSKGKSLLSKESILAVARHIAQKGSDSWFTDSPRKILGDDFKLPEGFDCDDLQKEENIFDVWFESGCSWYSAAYKKGWEIPVDLYLEGSDQHRGWFQLSLLPAIGSKGKAPYKGVLTHGFTVDEKGMKQSKSLGNYVNAQDEISKYGSDILRLWVSSVNYQEDIRCTDELIGRTQDAYRKIRNTLRYLLGNLNDFNPEENGVPYKNMNQIDQWALQQLQKLILNVRGAYESYAFHKVFSCIYNFCTVEMSSVYMDVLKDRMYCEAQDSLSRRSGQSAMNRILDCLVRMLAPILVHTSEEAWCAMKFESQQTESVHLATMPEADEDIDRQSTQQRWDKIMELRDEVLRVLEGLRQEQKIGSNQEASVTVYTSDEQLKDLLKEFGLEQFAALCIVSEVRMQPNADGTTVVAEKSSHNKCERCWNYWPSVGEDNEYPNLCRRCVEAVKTVEDVEA